MKILGREPAVWAGVIEAALAVLVATSVLKWDHDQTAAVMVVVVIVLGIITAFLTHDTMLGLLVGLIKAGGVLLASFGLTVSPEISATIIGLVVALAAMFQRTQTSPVVAPTFGPGVVQDY